MTRSLQYNAYIQSSKWRDKSRKIIKNYPRCALFPWLRSRHCHHMTYANFQKESLWIDLMPLSKTGHKIIHFPLLWNSRNPGHIPRILTNYYLRFIGFPLSVTLSLIFGKP